MLVRPECVKGKGPGNKVGDLQTDDVGRFWRETWLERDLVETDLPLSPSSFTRDDAPELKLQRPILLPAATFKYDVHDKSLLAVFQQKTM